MEIKNYVLGEWVSGEGKEIDHIHAITGETISTTSSKGLDFSSILEYGRKKGSSALRKMTFQQRGEMLKSLALHLNRRKEVFYTLSKATGATRIDSWIDIDGGIGNLFANASLRRQFPDLPYYIDGQISCQWRNSARHSWSTEGKLDGVMGYGKHDCRVCDQCVRPLANGSDEFGPMSSAYRISPMN